MHDQKAFQEICSRIQRSRMRLLVEHGFYGLLLMHVKLQLDPSIKTAATDGDSIFFSPGLLSGLSDTELDFIMLHEIMHIVLDHLTRAREFKDRETANTAADIIVNSYIYEEYGNKASAVSINGKEALHRLPDGSEGNKHSFEEVYQLLKKQKRSGTALSSKKHSGGKVSRQKPVDDHTKWDNAKDDTKMKTKWCKNISDAAQAIEMHNRALGCGGLPMLAQIILKRLRSPVLNWKTILYEFLQQQITDYSFLPPDRRFSDSDLFLPDFNLPEDSVKNILFMIDTSGSMSCEQITNVYSEVKGSVDQYDGNLKGWLGFFDAQVVAPIPFEDADELLSIKPAGGGGTSFHAVFEYVRDNMQNDLPDCIIIMSDGLAEYPDESAALGIPVLWIIVNESSQPPWGKVIHLPA